MTKITKPVVTDTMPVLSVILIAPETFSTIRTTIRHLRAQANYDRLEIIIATPVPNLAVDEAECSGFCSVIMVYVPGATVTGAFRAESVRHATAPIVVIGEDHSYPQAGWAEEILNGYSNPAVAAVGVSVANGNPEKMLSWSNMYFCWGPFIDPTPTGPRMSLPPHNTSYRRHILLEYGDRLEYFLSSEHFLFPDLLSRGYILFLNGKARTRHCNPDTWAMVALLHYNGARHFAGMRRQQGWHWWQCGFHAVAAWLRGALKIVKSLKHIHRTQQLRRLMPMALPHLTIMAILHSWGESVGYILGTGNASERYTDIELRGHAALQ